MAETVKATGVSKESGYLYYLGKDGNVWRSQMARAGKGGGNAEKVADAGVTREGGYLYFIDKNDNGTRLEAIYRLSYLAKVRGKGYRDIQAKDYGTSRLQSPLIHLPSL